MSTYEEQQKALRATVPKGTAGAAELARQGFTDVGIEQPKQVQPGAVSGQPDATVEPEGLTKVPTQSVGPKGEQIFDVFAGQEHIADPSDPRLKGIDIAGLPEGQSPTGFKSKFETGFDKAKTELGDKAGDVSGAQGTALTSQYAPARTNDFSSMFVKQDEFLGGLTKAFQEYINPVNQRTSLRDEYSKMLKDTGIQQIDLELVDMKNVIEGSEEDLRTEITKAGGFATESQIQALTNSRNKQLIKNYNRLVDTRNAKEKYLETSIGLEQADRASADQRFNSMFNMGVQIANMQQQMQTNARNQMQWLATNVGFDGLFDSTKGDPYYMSLVEQTLGLPSGGLATAANQAKLVRTQKAEKEKFELEETKAGIALKGEQLKMAPLERGLKAEQIKTEKAEQGKLVADTEKIIAGQKGSILDPSTPEGRKQLALNKGQIDQINNVLVSGNMKTAVGPNVFSRFGSLRNIFRPGAANFIGDIEQLASQLNLQSLIDAKSRGATFGALSDQELQVLSNSATKIGAWRVKDKNGNVTGYKVKESDFKRELDKINNFAKLDYVYRGGSPEDVGVQIIDGKYYTKNSDGSITEL